MNKVKPYAKAIAALLIPILGPALYSVYGVLMTGRWPDAAMWKQAAAVALATAIGVYLIPNRDPRATHQDESVQPPEKPQEYRAKHRDEPPSMTEMSLRRSSVVRIDGSDLP